MSLTARSKEEDVRLFGPDGVVFSPTPIPASKRSTEALRLFQSFLCNSSDEREGLGNVIFLWEQIPKFSGEHLNNKSGIVPNDHHVDFWIGERLAKITLFPGTYYPNSKSSKPLRRFPGVREQAVEQALIHHACAQAEVHSINGEVSYYVKFSIRDIAKILKMMGSTLSHGQIREALEVLSSTIMTISTGDNLSNENRDPILPSFERNKDEDEVVNGRDYWSVKLHPLIAHAILNVTYRQYPLSKTKGFSAPGAFLIRQMHYVMPNISVGVPFTFRLTDLKRLTAGLNHVKFSASVNAMRRELEKMKVEGLLEDFDTLDIFPAKRMPGRPSAIDAEFTLYPTQSWVKRVMAGSKRMAESERSLGLPRTQRNDRQMSLPNF